MISYIDRILNTHWYPDICRTPDDYKTLAKHLHPDTCRDNRAIEAFTHLNSIRNDFEKGYVFRDESGEYRSNYLRHKWNGDINFLKTSKLHYDKIKEAARKNFDAGSFSHFMKYIPSNLGFEEDSLVYHSQRKCIPLSKAFILLPGTTRNKHVNWIYSRMIEFVTMMESIGITHAGLNPDSIFIVPETHAIKVTSFYHVCTDKVTTINGKYKNYYPAKLFDTKRSGPYIDLNLIKKTAICGLGDVSGSGVSLRADKDINKQVLSYLMHPEQDACQSMVTWRSILDKNFVKEFITLNI